MSLCQACIWDCNEQNVALCDNFFPAYVEEPLLDGGYLKYIKDSYEEYQSELDRHSDAEWFLDPQ